MMLNKLKEENLKGKTVGDDAQEHCKSFWLAELLATNKESIFFK
jgi:hypothetical protein